MKLKTSKTEKNLIKETEEENSFEVLFEEFEQDFKKKFVSFLELEKIISYGQDKEIICDLERIKNLTTLEIRKAGLQNRFVKQLNGIKRKRTVNWRAMLLEYFYGKKVVAKSDHASSKDFNPKPLFYAPVKTDAFDIGAIRSAEFHLTPGELTGSWEEIGQFYLENFGYNAKEADLAARIFHPNYGAGERSGGRLMVKKQFSKDGYVPISSNWIEDCSGLKKDSSFKTKTGNEVSIWMVPKIALSKEEYKNLRQSGLLRFEDFRHLETGSTANTQRRESRIGKRGVVYLQGAKYTLGSQFENHSLIRLDESTYGIANGFGIVTHVFRALDQQDVSLREQEKEKEKGRKPKKGDISFRKDEIELIPYDEVEFSRPHEGETHQEYAKRMVGAVKHFKLIKEFSDAMVSEVNLGIHRLSVREQELLYEFAHKYRENYDKVFVFAKKYGLEGLRTFSACEFGQEMGSRILELGENLNEESGKALFRKYNEIIIEADKAINLIGSLLAQKGLDASQILISVRENLSRRAKELLIDFNIFASRGGSHEETLRKLESIKADIMLFAASFKEVSKNSSLELAELSNVILESKLAADLMPGEKEEMMRIFTNNRTDGYSQRLLSAVTSDFEKSFETPESKFYILKYAGNIVAFMRIDPRGENKVYAASFNVRPEAKGSEIGTAMMREIIDKLAKGNIIEAVAYSKKPKLIDFYTKQFGFKIVGMDDNYLSTGERFFQLERNDSMERRYDQVA